MKCACGDKTCENQISFDGKGNAEVAIEAVGQMTSAGYHERVVLYADANALVQLITEAREHLLAMTGKVQA